MALYFLDDGCATTSHFTPTIAQDMGHEDVMTQCMTNRNWHIVFGFALLAFVSCIIVVTVKESKIVRYAIICFYSAFPLIQTWASEEMSLPAWERAVAMAAINAVGNLSVIHGSNMWPEADAPPHVPGWTATVGMCGGATVLAAVLSTVFKFVGRWQDKRTDGSVIHGRPFEAESDNRLRYRSMLRGSRGAE